MKSLFKMRHKLTLARRREFGVRRGDGRQRLPDMALRERIWRAWEALGPLHPRDRYFRLHQSFPNLPIEALEMTFPFRVTAYGLRPGSGGVGRHRGGNGVVREYLLLAPTTVTMLSERRSVAPWGLAGGEAGEIGRNVLLHADGVVETLPGKFTRRLQAGDRLRIETPGGGGWGEPA